MAQHPMFSGDMVEIVDSFIVETNEIFEKLDNEILELEKRPEDKELVNSIFRAVHTVKGTSGFLSFEQMSILAHRFEDVLNKLRRDELKFQSAMMDVMFEAFDLMKVLLKQVVDHDIQEIDLAPTIKKLESLSSGVIPEKAGAEVKAQKAESTAPAETTTAHEGKPQANPQTEDKTETPGVEPKDAAHQDTASGSQQPSQTQKADKTTDTTIRVDVSRLDHLMNLVGELVLGRNRLSQIVISAGDEEEREDFARQLNETSTQIDFITTELQTAVMKTRMVQIGKVFNRFPRLVRDIAREFSKEIDLVIEGEETELDKSIIEEISDPLVHLIRNAADHGVESPDEREKLGKPRRGTVYLSAGHEGNHIIIEIQDDGAGIDPERLKVKALEKGLITQEEAHEMKTEDAYSLIFIPGFSTAQRVSSVSGRGVGMDVVKTNITKLNGIIAVESAVGKGTKFTLKLPLTLAIIQGLLVGVGSETFAVPLSSVLEVVHTPKNEVSTVHGREVIRLRETVLPLVDISEILDVPGRDEASRSFYTVVVGVANHKFGIVVDRLVGQKEIVIKPLGAYLKNIPGIAGSTILGDGRVIMILDAGELLRLVQKKNGSKMAVANEVRA
ncbi:MAG: chemotaxis protein CheA [Bacteroidetes bacterium]|nr:chemotaxis protein CheA [Bacteroidota bacterium]MCL5738217.1 chemotaxis protein CheA [Bacteroidota bacterium]